MEVLFEVKVLVAMTFRIISWIEVEVKKNKSKLEVERIGWVI